MDLFNKYCLINYYFFLLRLIIIKKKTTTLKVLKFKYKGKAIVLKQNGRPDLFLLSNLRNIERPHSNIRDLRNRNTGISTVPS